MRIGIHAATLLPRLTGRESYVQSLLEALAEIDVDNDYFVFVSPSNRRLFERPEPHFHTVQLRLPRFPSRRFWELAYLRFSVQVTHLDLIHLTEAPVPFYQPAKAVATVHDVLPALYPQFFPFKARHYYRMAFARGAPRLRGISVNSRQTRNDLIERFAVSPERVWVIPYAANKRFKPVNDGRSLQRVREKYGLPPRFILYVGTIEPRKNICCLLRAFARARERGLPHTLVIAGGRGWLCDDVFRTAAEPSIAQHVRFTGFVEQDDLPGLYRAAEFFVYPSLYEGFGFPPLEAMSAGLPVICSNRSSLPEVVGEAALLVDPEDERALADAIWEAANNDALRVRLRREGLERAALFTWERTARETLRFYEHVYRGIAPAFRESAQNAA